MVLYRNLCKSMYLVDKKAGWIILQPCLYILTCLFLKEFRSSRFMLLYQFVFRAKFGHEVGGGGGIGTIFSIAKSQINQRKVTTKFEVNRCVKTEKKRKHKSKLEESGIKLEDGKVKLDHRHVNKIPISYK